MSSQKIDFVDSSAIEHSQNDENQYAVADDLRAIEELLVARAYLYLMFHKLFGGEPTIEFMKTLGSEYSIDVVAQYAIESDILADFKSILKDLPDKAQDKDFMWALEAEYTRHFIGPSSLVALPWESPYLSQETVLFQESTLAVRKAYASEGLVPKRLKKLPDDHISLMCDFMTFQAESALRLFRNACERPKGAQKANLIDLSRLETVLTSQGVFLHEHMSSWMPEFAKESCVVRQAKRSTALLYPQAAKSIAEFIRLDEVFLQEVIIWIKTNNPLDGASKELMTPFSAEFTSLDRAQESLAGIRLFGLEDNELERIAQERGKQ